MTFMTVRASTVSRLAALVLLVSMMSPFIASSPADPLAATTRVIESAGNEAAALDVLVEPLAGLAIEPRFAAMRLNAPQAVTKTRTQTDEILRL